MGANSKSETLNSKKIIGNLNSVCPYTTKQS